MTVGKPPLDWKSSRWWAHRSPEERTAWANIPKRYTALTLSELELPANVLKQSNEWIEAYVSGETSGLLITGGASSGKTALAQAIGKEIINRTPSMVYFLSSDRYVEMIKDSFDADNGELPEMYEMPWLIKYVRDVFHLPIIDSLGRERPTDFSQYELGALLRRRWEECRCTLITTSLSLIDVSARYGDSARAVLEDMNRIQIKGDRGGR